jgi:O-antigen/teichoic acid export membrane protein
MSDLPRFFKHTSVYAVGNMLVRAAGFLLLPLYTTHLTTAHYGVLELFYSASAILSTLLGMGLAHATLRFYFEYDDEAQRRIVVSTTLVATLAIAVPPILLLLPFSGLIADLAFDGDFVYGIPIVLATLVLELMRQVCLAYFRAREYSVRYVVSALLQLAVQVAANVYTVAVLRLGVEGVLFGNMLAVLAGTGYLLRTTLRECGFRFRFGLFREIFAYCYPFLLNSMVGVVVHNADRFLISHFVSLEGLGIYALALKFGQMLRILVIESFQLGFGSFRFSIIHRSDAKETIARIATYYLLLVVIPGLGLSVFAREIITVMATPDYLPAASLIPVLVLGTCFGCLGYVFQTGVLFEKSTGKILKVGVIQSSVLLALDASLIPLFGYVGAVFAMVVAAITQGTALFVISQRLYPVTYDFRRIGTMLLAGIGAFALSLQAPTHPLWLAVGLKVLVLVGFLVALLLGRVLYGDEWEGIRGWLRSRGKPIAAVP